MANVAICKTKRARPRAARPRRARGALSVLHDDIWQTIWPFLETRAVCALASTCTELRQALRLPAKHLRRSLAPTAACVHEDAHVSITARGDARVLSGREVRSNAFLLAHAALARSIRLSGVLASGRHAHQLFAAFGGTGARRLDVVVLDRALADPSAAALLRCLPPTARLAVHGNEYATLAGVRLLLQSTGALAGLRAMELRDVRHLPPDAVALLRRHLPSTCVDLTVRSCDLAPTSFRDVERPWRLRALDVGCNTLGEDGVEALVALLDPSALEELDLEDTFSYEHLDVASLSAFFAGARRLRALNLSSNELSHGFVVQCKAGLRALESLEALKVADNILGSQGLTELVRMKHRRLTHLDASDNSCERLRLSCSFFDRTLVLAALRVLDLSDNYVTNLGLRKLSRCSLKHSLRSLFLAGNRLGDGECGALCAVIHALQELQHLDLCDNELTSNALACISRVLRALGRARPTMCVVLENNMIRATRADAGRHSILLGI